MDIDNKNELLTLMIFINFIEAKCYQLMSYPVFMGFLLIVGYLWSEVPLCFRDFSFEIFNLLPKTHLYKCTSNLKAYKNVNFFCL